MADRGSVGESRIDCPNCGQEIDVNDILTHQVEERIKKSYGERIAKDRKQLQAQMDAVQQQQLTLEQEKQDQ